MFEVSVSSSFSAAHHLEGYQGKCEAQHGHNWKVEVYVRGEDLDDTGMLIDFRNLKDSLRDVLSTFDHTDLNTLEPFKKNNPTSENIAIFLYKELSLKLNCDKYQIYRVTVHETPESGASYGLDTIRKGIS